MNPSAPQFKNRVLAALPKAEINRLRPHLSPVTLEQNKTLLDGQAPHGYFLEEGIASVVVTVANGDTVEVGIIGIDGVVGLPILLGTSTAPGRTFIQIAGSGFRIKADILKEEFERPGELRRHLHRYMQGFMVHIRPKRPLATVSTTSRNGLPAGSCPVAIGWNLTNFA